MIKVYWATRLRGFFKHLSSNLSGVEFQSAETYYETNTKWSKIKSKLIRMPLFDLVGLFQVVEIKDMDCDVYGTFNRFLNADKPYFIYLENPTALYHYVLNRIKYKSGSNRFRKCLENPNLKYIICMSKACQSGFEKINMKLPEHIKIRTIYPFVPDNKNVSEQVMIEKCNKACLEVLYCVQGIRFVSKGGLEALSAVTELCEAGAEIHLNIITQISDLEPVALDKIKKCQHATLHDFSYEYNDLEKIYSSSAILLQPASEESFGLTILEAMKGGCAIIASKLYAFPEMVEHEKNGFLVEPKFWFFDEDNIPNPEVWNRRKKTIYSLDESRKLVEEIKNYLQELYNDRNKLLEFCKCSLMKAKNSEEFSEESICEQWNCVFEEMTRTSVKE